MGFFSLPGKELKGRKPLKLYGSSRGIIECRAEEQTESVHEESFFRGEVTHTRHRQKDPPRSSGGPGT